MTTTVTGASAPDSLDIDSRYEAAKAIAQEAARLGMDFYARRSSLKAVTYRMSSVLPTRHWRTSSGRSFRSVFRRMALSVRKTVLQH